MQVAEIDRLARGYLESFRQTRDDSGDTGDSEEWDGYRKLEDIFLESEGLRRVELLDRLASACVTQEELAFVGAGPVEDYLVLADGPPDIDALAAVVAKNTALRQTLNHAWVSEDDVPVAIAAKIRQHFPSLMK